MGVEEEVLTVRRRDVVPEKKATDRAGNNGTSPQAGNVTILRVDSECFSQDLCVALRLALLAVCRRVVVVRRSEMVGHW